MSKNIYCVGKINGNGTVMNVSLKNDMQLEKSTPSKRVDIVSIKMIRESSILYKDRKVGSSNDAYNLLKEMLEYADREYLIVCCLDTKNQPTCINVVSIGTLNSSLVHPREVFKSAILSNAAGIIVAHNHPSGDPCASNEDINITNRLNEASKIMGINLIDHIIIGSEGNYCSLKEKGII